MPISDEQKLTFLPTVRTVVVFPRSGCPSSLKPRARRLLSSPRRHMECQRQRTTDITPATITTTATTTTTTTTTAPAPAVTATTRHRNLPASQHPDPRYNSNPPMRSSAKWPARPNPPKPQSGSKCSSNSPRQQDQVPRVCRLPLLPLRCRRQVRRRACKQGIHRRSRRRRG